MINDRNIFGGVESNTQVKNTVGFGFLPRNDDTAPVEAGYLDGLANIHVSVDVAPNALSWFPEDIINNRNIFGGVELNAQAENTVGFVFLPRNDDTASIQAGPFSPIYGSVADSANILSRPPTNIMNIRNIHGGIESNTEQENAVDFDSTTKSAPSFTYLVCWTKTYSWFKRCTY